MKGLDLHVQAMPVPTLPPTPDTQCHHPDGPDGGRHVGFSCWVQLLPFLAAPVQGPSVRHDCHVPPLKGQSGTEGNVGQGGESVGRGSDDIRGRLGFLEKGIQALI